MTQVRFMAVGDLMFSGGVRERLGQSRPTGYPFAAVADYLRQADFLYGNFETMCAEGCPAESFADGGKYGTDQNAIEALARAGFDAVSLANNHMYDFGPAAVDLTCAALQDKGIAYHGIGRDRTVARTPLLVEIGELRLGLLAYCSAATATDGSHKYVTSPIDSKIIGQDVRELSRQRDLVIVTLHEGSCNYPSPEQRQHARAAIDAGARLVLCHHSHLINGLEEYGGGLIAYGLGNFVADFAEPAYRKSFILDCRLEKGRVTDYAAIPVYIGDDFSPELAQGNMAQEIAADLQRYQSLLLAGESDRQYFAVMNRSFLGVIFREIGRGWRTEGPAVVWRKLKKLRPHHFRLILGALWHKLNLRPR